MNFLNHLLAVLLSAVPASPAPEPVSEPVSEPVAPIAAPAYLSLDDLRSRIVVQYSVGHTAKDDLLNRQVGRKDLNPYGWSYMVNNTVLPEMNSRGLSRLMVKNPFGTLPDALEPMQFDQFQNAKAARLNWLTKGFSKAWKPVTDQGIQVIAYIGSPKNDLDSQLILATLGERAWEKFAMESVGPFLDSGMDIGYDAASGAAEDSATFRFSERLKSLGAKVYVESVPQSNHHWWLDSDIIAVDKTWRHRTASEKFASADDLIGDVIRYVRLEAGWVSKNPENVWPAAVCQVLSEGATVMFVDDLLKSSSRTISGLRDCAQSAAEKS